jgi:hypothetical protein
VLYKVFTVISTCSRGGCRPIFCSKEFPHSY